MITLLAQLSLESMPSLVLFIVGGSGAIFLINQVLTFYKDHMKEQPTPSNTYATKEQHEELKGRVEKISDEIRDGFQRLDHKRSQSVAGLHDDLKDSIDDLRKEVKEDIGGVQQRITSLVDAVGQLRGRIES